MPEPITTSALAVAIATRTFEELAGALSKAFLSGITDHLLHQYERLTLNFQPHLKATYERCTKIKTILKKDEPIDLVSHYVDLDFSCGGREYNNGSAIEEMRQRKKVVIFGTAGTGKTVFMRYFWLSLFYAHDGRIPVFVELRKLNDITTPNLLAYIRTMFVGAGSDVSPELFEELTRKGKFVFMLDGFDEVTNEKKNSIEKQILDLANSCPNLIVIVSSRPNDRLNAWQLFSVFQVKPLEKHQVIDLISKINYEPEIKQKFLKRIDKDLFARHQSFLSSPLLATMMLMTFSEFVDIPQKVYLFYQQAFETLFLRHDAAKEAFQRQMYTNLSMHEFAVCFSYFCLVSYLDQRFEFTYEDVREYLTKGFSVEGSRAEVDDFLKDLLESVCILQREGLLYVFSHRSFQEYFAACAIARLPKEHASQVLELIATRSGDDVIPMLFDMNQELVEQIFVVPLLERTVPELKEIAGRNVVGGFMDKMDVHIRILRLSGERFAPVFESLGDKYRSLSLLFVLYPGRADFTKRKREHVDATDSAVLKQFFEMDQIKKPKKRYLGSVCLKVTKEGTTYRFWRNSFAGNGGAEEVSIPVDPNLVGQLYIASYMEEFVNSIIKLQGYIARSRRKKANTLDAVLSSLSKSSKFGNRG